MISKKPTVWKIDTQLVSVEQIASWCFVHHGVDRMLVIVPASPGRWRYGSNKDREKAQAVLHSTHSLFGRHILHKMSVSAWPGTELMGGVASAFIIEFNEKVKATISNTEPDLNKWRHDAQPPLPEDICLFRTTDSYPTFVSNSHEERAWLITDKIPGLKGFSKSEFRPEDLFFEGDYFCKKFKKNQE